MKHAATDKKKIPFTVCNKRETDQFNFEIQPQKQITGENAKETSKLYLS